MSSPDRRKLLTAGLALLASASLSACGFEPIYGTGGTGIALRDKVAIAAPENIASNDDVDAYYLVRRLEERLGRSTVPDYELGLSLSAKEVSQAITAGGDITRYSLTGEARYTLTRIEDGGVVASGEVQNFTGYSASGTTVQTQSSAKDAHQRLMVILADQIVLELLARDIPPHTETQ